MAAALVAVAAIRVSGSTTVRHVSSADTTTRSSWAACHPQMVADGEGVVLGVAVAEGVDDAAADLQRVSSSSSLRPTVEVSH